MEMESEDVSYEEDLLPEEGHYLNEELDQDLTGVDVDKLLADEDEDHNMGASVDEVTEDTDENAEVETTENADDAEDNQENSDTMEDESTEFHHVCYNFYFIMYQNCIKH